MGRILNAKGSHKTVIGTVVGISSSHDERFAWFEKRMDTDLESSDHVGTSTIDMLVYKEVEQRHVRWRTRGVDHYAGHLSRQQTPNTTCGSETKKDAPFHFDC
ncbi:PREDICTED: uncharacterized protein LOC109173246 isoform X2 [Ipomoea nil]|uniref:uncharacterized protein LOC109173246 isoform X2 n=1 Tax=Ipomoea nil TaxID=35883 RepID=UPI000900FE8E|nr:PREDICTED: uncharacterized protein LOC109173246 isoform X2 [Ipomoea nil]